MFPFLPFPLDLSFIFHGCAGGSEATCKVGQDYRFAWMAELMKQVREKVQTVSMIRNRG